MGEVLAPHVPYCNPMGYGILDYMDNWLAILTTEQAGLWKQAWSLLEREQGLLENGKADNYIDYGFIVFPAAKVYEGFLKSYFYNMGMISQGSFLSEHFRIGKSLNPDLPKRIRDETWLFDDVSELCGEPTARQLWSAWKIGRNQIFHYNGNGGEHNLSLLEAEERLRVIQAAIQAAARCEMRVKR
jgi:hypothetical protein